MIIEKHFFWMIFALFGSVLQFLLEALIQLPEEIDEQQGMNCGHFGDTPQTFIIFPYHSWHTG